MHLCVCVLLTYTHFCAGTKKLNEPQGPYTATGAFMDLHVTSVIIIYPSYQESNFISLPEQRQYSLNYLCLGKASNQKGCNSSVQTV